VIGVVSEADLLRKEESHDRGPALLDSSGRPESSLTAGAVTAEELMTAPAVTVQGDATVAEAARIMARSRVKRLPVVDPDGRLSGIVSRTDLLKVFLRADEEIAADVRRELSGAPFLTGEPPEVRVEEGVVTVRGSIADTSYIPLAVRLVRTVEGVVDVEPRLTGPGPAQEPGPGEPRAGPRGGTVSR
jgi:CBS-domain-containing membrane protein